jgi:hypothetical protein
MRNGIARAPRQSAFRLESEIRHVTNAGEIRRCATLLNSGDVATLLSGTRLAAVESADILSNPEREADHRTLNT